MAPRGLGCADLPLALTGRAPRMAPKGAPRGTPRRYSKPRIRSPGSRSQGAGTSGKQEGTGRPDARSRWRGAPRREMGKEREKERAAAASFGVVKQQRPPRPPSQRAGRRAWASGAAPSPAPAAPGAERPRAARAAGSGPLLLAAPRPAASTASLPAAPKPPPAPRRPPRPRRRPRWLQAFGPQRRLSRLPR
jgi:hypothetical protein